LHWSTSELHAPDQPRQQNAEDDIFELKPYKTLYNFGWENKNRPG